ncbi:MAG: hypothetical protein ACQEP8_01195 [Chlamydiota bacterium]
MDRKFLYRYHHWDEAEKEWEAGAQKASQHSPLKTTACPKQPISITTKTAKNLPWKALKHLIKYDHGGRLRAQFLKHPFKYSWRFILSLLRRKARRREGDLFLYNLKSLADFKDQLRDDDSLLIVGFSYCHKPFECPAKRFSTHCNANPDDPVCRQCYIGKAFNFLPQERIIPLVITTTHYIGEQIFKIVHQNPGRKIFFMITACELALEMFSDWGNITNLQGIGVKLDGLVCNNMKAFEISERGIKPALTTLSSKSQETLLQCLKLRS